MDRESEQEAPAPPTEPGGGEPELGTSVRRTSSIIERLAAAATPSEFEGRAEFVGTPSFARGLWRIAPVGRLRSATMTRRSGLGFRPAARRGHGLQSAGSPR